MSDPARQLDRQDMAYAGATVSGRGAKRGARVPRASPAGVPCSEKAPVANASLFRLTSQLTARCSAFRRSVSGVKYSVRAQPRTGGATGRAKSSQAFPEQE